MGKYTSRQISLILGVVLASYLCVILVLQCKAYMYDAAGLNLILSFQQFDTAGTEVFDEAECPEGFAKCMYTEPHSFSFLEI